MYISIMSHCSLYHHAICQAQRPLDFGVISELELYAQLSVQSCAQAPLGVSSSKPLILTTLLVLL